MDKAQIKEFIARRAAQEFRTGDVVNLGIGLPTLIPTFLSSEMEIVIQSEPGIVGAGSRPPKENEEPMHVVDAGGNPSSVNIGGSFMDSATSFGMIRGGHIDCTVLGALEVDEEGNLSNWIIPGKKVPGMGGAMDLVVGAKKVIVTMEHTISGNPKILKKCSLPFTAVKCVNLIITEMGVIKVTSQGLVLLEYNPYFTIQEIQAATEARLHLSPNIRKTLFHV